MAPLVLLHPEDLQLRTLVLIAPRDLVGGCTSLSLDSNPAEKEVGNDFLSFAMKEHIPKAHI